MVNVGLNEKDLKRIISLLSEHFAEKELKYEDQKLLNKIEIIHDALKEMNEDDDEEYDDL